MKYTLLDHVVRFAAKHSDDPRLKVGACIVKDRHVFGTNRFLSVPDGYTKDQLVSDRELKLKHITHAEADALLKMDGRAEGSTMYVNYTPCVDCAMKIVASGIKRVVVRRCENEAVATRWRDSWQEAISLFQRNGIEYVER